jgi:hypothetical protein
MYDVHVLPFRLQCLASYYELFYSQNTNFFRYIMSSMFDWSGTVQIASVVNLMAIDFWYIKNISGR